MGKILGIDLGTTFSAMAVVEGGDPKILENQEGDRTTPSVVAMSKKGERLVGSIARRQQVTNPENTIFAAKRLIGRHYDSKEVKESKKNLPYEIRKEKDGEGVEIKFNDEWKKVPEISAMVLQKLKKDAEEKLGEEVTEAIITVPAYFDDSQRKATKVAGEIAGFDVKRVINEPTAAALAYGLNQKQDKNILVYDFGGGTFDVSVLEVGDDTIEVQASGGDSHLGGEDFDNAILNWMVKKFKNENGIDLSKDKLALQRLKEAAEKAKIELSSTKKAEINIPFVTSDDEGPKHLNYSLSRSEFENLVDDFIDRSIKMTKKTLKESGISAGDIDEIVLVGGQTRTPLIQERIKEVFGKEPNKEINPDEVVAVGAAVQGGIMGGDVKDVLLLDVTPLSLGIETLGGKFTKLIEKNTTIPASETETFSTAANNQTSVQINVLQGERPMAKDNKSLGQFILDGIPPAPRGVPQIEVKFDIDANGILNVSAKDKGTGKEQSIRIEGSCGISDEEVEKMKKEAEEHAEEDKKKEKLLDAKTEAESLIYSFEKTKKDMGDNFPEEEIKDIEKELKELEELKETDDVEKAEEIKEKTEELSEKVQQIGAKMYEQQQKAQAEAQPNEDEDVEEAEVEEEDNEDEEK
ncbi:MAG: molecular chaperone DnaK [Patescibacteria group bacterium]